MWRAPLLVPALVAPSIAWGDEPLIGAPGGGLDALCNVYNTWVGPNSKLIGFVLMIMVVSALVLWFGQVGGDRRASLGWLFAFVPITAAVILAFPQILSAMGIATC